MLPDSTFFPIKQLLRMNALKYMLWMLALALTCTAAAQQPVDVKVNLSIQNETAVNTEGL